jgi:hypothetical protein
MRELLRRIRDPFVISVGTLVSPNWLVPILRPRKRLFDGRPGGNALCAPVAAKKPVRNNPLTG